MAVELTDAELIRLCLEGRAEEFSEAVLHSLRERLPHSELLRTALRSSAHANWLRETAELSAEPVAASVDEASVRARGAARRRKRGLTVVAMLLLIGIAWQAGKYAGHDQEDATKTGEMTSSESPLDQNSNDAAAADKSNQPPAIETAAATANGTPSDRMPGGSKSETAPAIAKSEDPQPNAAAPEAGSSATVATTKPVATPATETEPPPWTAALDPQKPIRSVDDVAWLPPGLEAPDVLLPDVIRKWLEPLPGRPFGVSEEKVDSRRFTRFDGQARLKAPWPANALLRMGFYDVERCSLFVWRGNKGLRVKWHQNLQPNVWAVHQVTRSDRNAPIEDGALLTVDCGRWQRSNFGPLDLRVENNHLLLTRGPMPILMVPFEGLPEEVVLDGRLKLRQFEMHRTEPLSDELLADLIAPQGTNLLTGSEPGRQNWRFNAAEGSRFDGLLASLPAATNAVDAKPAETTTAAAPVTESKPATNGDVAPNATLHQTPSVELVTTSASKQIATALLSVSNPGLCEYVFRVEHADPGTGFCLSGADGTPLWLATWVWDPAAGRTALSLQGQNENRVEERFDREARPAPWTGSEQWLRIVAGWSSVSLWVSPDGRNWGWVGDSPRRGVNARHQQVGLFAHPGAERQIRLSHLEIRELPMLASLADPAVVAQVGSQLFEPLTLLDSGAWLHRVIRTQPKDVEFTAWRRACSIAALRRVPTNELATFLISGLLADALQEWKQQLEKSEGESIDFDVRHVGKPGAPRLPNETRVFPLLCEAALMSDLFDHGRGVQFAQILLEAERQLALHRSGLLSTSNGVEDKPAASDGVAANQRRARRTASLDATLASLAMPFWSQFNPPLSSLDAVRIELVSLIESGRDVEARQLIDQTCFWNHNAHPHRPWWSMVDPLYPTVVWAELTALRSLDSEAHARRVNLTGRWKTQLTPMRHPLAQPVSKEAYNVMAEFRAAVSGKSFNDACQVIASAGGANSLGLLPDRADDRLLIAFPQAVSAAMNEYPQLRQSMNEKYGELGRLRVRQAMQNGDVQAVEAATVQFFGTLAAAESEQWLGDRALAGGQFSEARSWYQRALADYRRNQQVQTADTVSLAARLQMVAAMLGNLSPEAIAASSVSPMTNATPAPNANAPPSQAVISVADNDAKAATIEALSKLLQPGTVIPAGTQQLDAAQWVTLSKELQARSASMPAAKAVDLTTAPTGVISTLRVPVVRGYKYEARAKLEGDVGEHAGNSAPPDVDWMSRQLGVLQSGSQIIFNNRFQLTCFDTATNTIKWSQPIGADHGATHHWPMIPMLPLDAGEVVFCRRLMKQGPELVCCQKDTGAIRWRVRPELTLVSDPFLIRGRLKILALRSVEAGPGELCLLSIHQETGTVEETIPIVRLFDVWQNVTPAAQVTVKDGLFWFSSPGVAGCCDVSGQTLWLRQRSWVPATLDSGDRHTRAWQPPLLSGEGLIITQPDSPTMDCLDAAAGHVLWQIVIPERRRLIAEINGLLLIESRWGIHAVRSSTGRQEWQLPATDLLDAVALAPEVAVPVTPPMPMPGGFETIIKTPSLLLVRALEGLDNRKGKLVPTLVWVDIEQGREVARAGLDGLEDAEPRFGPLIVTGDRLFALSAKTRKEATRDLLELLPDDTRRVSIPANQRVWAGWHPEFRTARFPDNRFTTPELARFPMTETMQFGMEAVAPGWVAIMPPQPSGTGYRAEHRGQKDVLAVRLAPRALSEEQQKSVADTPIDSFRLFRDATVPDSASAGLRFRVGHEPGQKWLLTIEVGCDKPMSMIIDDGTAPTGWQEVHFSLARFAGQQARLVITCAPVEPKGETWIMLNGLSESRLPPPQDATPGTVTAR